LVEVFFTRGFDFTVQSPYASDFAPTRLFANVNKLSSRGEALLAAALIERKDSLATDQSSLLGSLLLKLNNKFRVQGRTAYIAWSRDSKYADLSASIDGLLALSIQEGRNPSDTLTEKLANWIAAPATEIWYSVGGMQAARSAYALARYDVTRGNDKPDFTLRVASGAFELLTTGNRAGVTFNSVGQAPVQATTNAWYLPPVGPASTKEKLEIYAKGTSGEASVVVALDFVPCERDRAKGPQCRVSTTPVYRGIDVQKVIRLFDPSTGASVPGAGITNAQSGEQVEVTIQISTPDDITNVRVVDWLPAGLEALDADEPTEGVSYNSWFYGWWVWAKFPVKEIRKDRVEAFAYSVAGGHAHAHLHRARRHARHLCSAAHQGICAGSARVARPVGWRCVGLVGSGVDQGRRWAPGAGVQLRPDQGADRRRLQGAAGAQPERPTDAVADLFARVGIVVRAGAAGRCCGRCRRCHGMKLNNRNLPGGFVFIVLSLQMAMAEEPQTFHRTRGTLGGNANSCTAVVAAPPTERDAKRAQT
jgi:hypothetical protein